MSRTIVLDEEGWDRLCKLLNDDSGYTHVYLDDEYICYNDDDNIKEFLDRWLFELEDWPF